MNTETQLSPSSSDRPSGALIAAGAATLLASACCLAPLALVLVGVSGAWIGQLSAFEPYQPYFAATAGLALVVAGMKIWRAPACDDGRPCAVPSAKRAQKAVFITAASLLALVIGFPLLAPLFY